MSFHLILILLFCLISIIPAFKEYTRGWTPAIKSRHLWMYSWTGHSLLLFSIAVVLKILELKITIVNLLAGTIMLVSGYGFLFLVIVSLGEKNTLWSSASKILFYSIHHLIMAFLGLWLLFTSQTTYFTVVLTIAILLFYARLMIPKGLNVPWILYKKSSVTLKMRKNLIVALIVFLYIILPTLTLLV